MCNCIINEHIQLCVASLAWQGFAPMSFDHTMSIWRGMAVSNDTVTAAASFDTIQLHPLVTVRQLFCHTKTLLMVWQSCLPAVPLSDQKILFLIGGQNLYVYKNSVPECFTKSGVDYSGGERGGQVLKQSLVGRVLNFGHMTQNPHKSIIVLNARITEL